MKLTVGYNKTVHELSIDFKKSYISMRREVSYNFPMEFGVTMKFVTQIKKCNIQVNICMITFLKGDALSPQLLNFALEYAIRMVQKIHLALKFNGTHQLLTYADDVNLLGHNIDITSNMAATKTTHTF
jgi:hypothetical protein